MLVPALLAVLLAPAPPRTEVALRELVEDLADALGVVPIVSPSVDRAALLVPATGDALLAQLEGDLGLSVRLENGRLLVWDPARESQAEPDLLSLPLPRVAQLPPRRDGRTFRFAGADGSVTATLPRAASSVDLPGCDPVRVVALPPDPFDGERRLFLPDAATCRAGSPYIVTPARDARVSAPPLPLGRCGGRYAVLSGDPAAAEPGRARADGPAPGHRYVLRARLLEVDPVRETPLVEPAARFDAADEVEVTGRFVHTPPGGRGRAADLWIGGALLSADPDRVELALAVTLVLDASGPGTGRVLVRSAHEQGLLSARPGETVRRTLSSTFGQGRSALVLEVTVDQAEEAR